MKNGITMIALIITIIVMIILASVSINAIVGDNGIITQAQNATVQNSIANLEEYLQELYIENYDDLVGANSKVEGLSNLEAYKDYFYNPQTVHNVGSLSYVITSDGYAIYLINKSELPDEIQDQLIGGDAGDGEYADYASLNDVYGVTSNLKVYYCSSGVDTITGIAKEELDVDDPARSITINDNVLASILESLSYITRNEDGTFSAQELRSITELTINKSNTSLTELYNLSNLQKIYFEDVSLTTLSGIENCPKLYYVYNKGSSISNYIAVGKLGSQLKYLYFYNIDDDELEIACSKTTGIGSYDLPNLEYFAVVGNTSYISSLSASVISSKSSGVYSISCLDNLTSTTKQAITYLSLQNNYLSSLDGISNFTNVYLLRCEYNLLEDLDEISNMANLGYLICGYNTDLVINNKLANTNLYLIYCNNCTSITSLYFLEDCSNITYIYASYCSIGANETSTKVTINDALVALQEKSNLTYLSLTYNTSLIWIDYIKDLANVDNCYLEGDTNIDSDSLLAIKYVILGNDDHVGCGYNYSLPSAKYSFLLLDDDTPYLDLSSQTVELSNFELLKGMTSLEKLSIANMTLQDEGENLSDEDVNSAVNEVLATLTGMKYLTLDGMSAVTSLAFVENMASIEELIITGTSITDISILETMCSSNGLTNLAELAIDNDNINLTAIQGAISKISSNSLNWSSSVSSWTSSVCSGVRLLTANLMKQLENCKNITIYRQNSGVRSYGGVLDLSNCSLLIDFCFSYCNNLVVKLPSSCETYYQNVCTDSYPDLTNCENISNIKLYVTNFTQENWEIMWQTSAGCLRLEYFLVQSYSSSNFSSLKCLSNLPEKNVLKSFTISKYSLSFNELTSLSGIEKCTNLKTLSISDTYVQDISALEELTSLTSITIKNSKVSEVYSLRNLSSLTYLNLTSNSINETASVSEVGTINNLEVLINLHDEGSLSTLILTDNLLNIESDNYKKLISLDWSSSSSF